MSDNLMHVFIRQRRVAWVQLLMFYSLECWQLKNQDGVSTQELMQQYGIANFRYETPHLYLNSIKQLSKNIKKLSKVKKRSNFISIGENFYTIGNFYEQTAITVENSRIEAAYPDAQLLLIQHYHRKAILAHEQAEYYYEQAVKLGYISTSSNFALTTYESLYEVLLKDNQPLKACHYALKAAQFRQALYLQRTSMWSARLHIEDTIKWFKHYYNLTQDLINQTMLPASHSLELAAQQARFYLDLVKSQWSIHERDEYLDIIRSCCDQLAQADNSEPYQALQTEFTQVLTAHESRTILVPLGSSRNFFQPSNDEVPSVSINQTACCAQPRYR